jgi:hypothetical protein
MIKNMKSAEHGEAVLQTLLKEKTANHFKETKAIITRT